MIFYFTGTGNSLWVAKSMAEAFSEKLLAISDYVNGVTITLPELTLTSGERIGFVFPVHSWGIPPIVRKFVKQLCINGYNGQTIFCIFTCGDECGYSKKMFLKLIRSKG
jgi:flavodoxin